VHEQGIEPHIPVFDNSQRPDGTFERAEFTYDHKADAYICPAGKELRQRQKIYRRPPPLVDENGMMRYRASKLDCQCCPLKSRCCPNAPARKILRSIHEGARDMARAISATDAYVTSRRERKKVEMLFAHLKRILKLDRRAHSRRRHPRQDHSQRPSLPAPRRQPAQATGAKTRHCLTSTTGYGEITANQRATRHPGRHQSERPADFDRNRWPTSIGMPGRHHRNPHRRRCAR